MEDSLVESWEAWARVEGLGKGPVKGENSGFPGLGSPGPSIFQQIGLNKCF